MKTPAIDQALCVDCEGCLELCPEVFFRNDTGLIDVAPLETYPEQEVEEAMKYCPSDCISWDEG